MFWAVYVHGLCIKLFRCQRLGIYHDLYPLVTLTDAGGDTGVANIQNEPTIE